MAKLTTKHRNALPDSAFAGPGRSYPVFDKSHAANAKARAAQHASPELRAKIDAKADKVLRRAGGGRTENEFTGHTIEPGRVDSYGKEDFQNDIANQAAVNDSNDKTQNFNTGPTQNHLDNFNYEKKIGVADPYSALKYNRGGAVTARGSETLAKLRARHGREV